MGHALIVEDDEDSARMIAALVAREGHTVMCAHAIAAARRLIAMQRPDLLLLDLHLPDGNGFDLLDDPEIVSDTMLVLMTGQASLETSIKALRLGAADYLVKPINPQHLKGLLKRLIAPSQLRAELDEVQELWRETGRFGHLIGRSQPMQRVYRQISRVAGTAVTVFIHGESGTGKELVARAVHDLSRRREQPFLAVNCGALSPHLVESEIFGHERGSFTGAERQHQGFFERAHGGTLFLDEVTEMPPELQVKLLRVLESGTFMRVGSTQVQQTDVRIIAATNRDAAEAVARGKMREDLLYRLNVFPIGLPPLRERGDDIALIANSFLQDLGRQEGGTKHLTQGALARLAAHRWPGNVRELRNVVQRAWVMASGDKIDEEWLPASGDAEFASIDVRAEPEIAQGQAHAPALNGGKKNGAAAAATPLDAGEHQIVVEVGMQLAEVERRVILATYERCGRHKERTAALLGISMKTLYNRLKEYQQ
ncbi:sigma-54 dependent transcriptional regulator [Variovorax sp. OV700]|uniref:sigma-54-dependent transcriptional regulator n=1 Tax=Variovorax sp. OV700 TaxID=1882826 RepID=UPI0008865A65|nr:sigma-54 dependent transcriptional regulator [Variovorax sp. OV700]SDH42778.1 DNA-binding transcriptional response regulator, NtrC family, contains REC, AAA-type ATPase, and a Fis-type DNA-binding domains [Variovorax sp. OV700]